MLIVAHLAYGCCFLESSWNHVWPARELKRFESRIYSMWPMCIFKSSPVGIHSNLGETWLAFPHSIKLLWTHLNLDKMVQTRNNWVSRRWATLHIGHSLLGPIPLSPNSAIPFLGYWGLLFHVPEAIKVHTTPVTQCQSLLPRIPGTNKAAPFTCIH